MSQDTIQYLVLDRCDRSCNMARYGSSSMKRLRAGKELPVVSCQRYRRETSRGVGRSLPDRQKAREIASTFLAMRPLRVYIRSYPIAGDSYALVISSQADQLPQSQRCRGFDKPCRTARAAG